MAVGWNIEGESVYIQTAAFFVQFSLCKNFI